MYAVTIFQENNDFKALCSDPLFWRCLLQNYFGEMKIGHL